MDYPSAQPIHVLLFFPAVPSTGLRGMEDVGKDTRHRDSVVLRQ